MSARIDHAAQAEEWLADAKRAEVSLAEAEAFAAIAQVHATLALVEQQRIASLIALHRHEVEYDIGGDRSYLYKPGSEDLQDDIKKALGL